MVKFQQVVFELGKKRLLNSVSFELKEGECFAILGASGAGKTTLLKLAVGLLKPRSGRIWLFGEEISNISMRRIRELRKNLAMVFQGNALFDFLDVRGNIGFTLKEVFNKTEKEIEPRVSSLLEDMALGPIGERFPRELSGGMKKRVALARALATNPSLLVADDPTSGLDPITGLAISEVLKREKKERGLSILLATNQMALVRRVADRVGFLTDGVLRLLGSPGELDFIDSGARFWSSDDRV